MRAVAYVRISELTDATTAPERQTNEARRWVEAHNGELVAIEEDLDVSGFKTGIDRPALLRAIERIERREADTLVVWRLDRLARSIVTFHEVLRRVEAAGGRLVSISESLDFSTPAGRMVASVLASFAEFESASISSRVKAAQDHLRSIGKWRGGRRPFGWRPEPAPDGKGHVLRLDPDEAPHLLEAARRVLAGDSPWSIATDMNRAGVKTAQGEEWTNATVRQMLGRPGVYGRDGEEPLLTKADWIEAQKALRSRPAPARAVASRTALLPKVQCGKCGSRMGMTTKRGGASKKRYLLYVCTNSRPGAVCGLSASADRVEETAVEKLLAIIGPLPVFTPADEVVDTAAEERAEIEAALERLEEDRYIGNLFNGEDGTERYRKLYASLTGKLESLPRPTVQHTETTIPLGITFNEAWEKTTSFEERQELLEAMPLTVVVQPGQIGRRFNPDRVEIRLE
jgi:site-specific DNA recombinase